MSHPVPLYLFAKAPIVGQVKQRLSPPLDQRQAAQAATAMLEHSAAVVDQGWPGARVLNVAPDLRHRVFSGLRENARWQTRIQSRLDLGERMREALQEGIDSCGAGAVLGTDIPTLDGAILETAYLSLQAGRQVVGPSQDGGFYLLGLNRIPAELFQGIDWGSASVYAQLMINARKLEMKIEPLPTLSDCDYFEDLRYAVNAVPKFGCALQRAGFDMQLLS